MTLVQLILMLFAAVSTGATANDHSAPLEWQTHYGTAKRMAQATKRPLVVVIENSTRAANQIDEKSLDSASRRKLADHDLVRVDANTAYGQRVAIAFGVREFPYTAITDDVSERIVFRKSGPMTKSDWTLALAKSTSPTPQPQFETVTARRPISNVTTSEAAKSSPISQPAIVDTQTNYGVPFQQPTYQSFVPAQVFAPNGMYQLPASQCVT